MAPVRDEPAGGFDIRREAELRVDRRDQPLAVAEVTQGHALFQGVAERLLNEHRGSVGQSLEGVEVLLGHQRDVVDGVIGCGRDGLSHRPEDMVDAVLVRERLSPGHGAVDQAPDRVSRLAVGRKVGILHDAAGADDDDGARPGRKLDDVGRSGMLLRVVRHPGHPFTAPTVWPRIRKRWAPRNTMSSGIIEMTVASASCGM